MGNENGITLSLMGVKVGPTPAILERPAEERGLSSLIYLIRAVAAWGEKRLDRVSDIYLVPCLEGLSLIAVGTSESYDFALSEEFSEFSSAYVVNGILAEAKLLPSNSTEELAAFFNPESALRIQLKDCQHA